MRECGYYTLILTISYLLVHNCSGIHLIDLPRPYQQEARQLDGRQLMPDRRQSFFTSFIKSRGDRGAETWREKLFISGKSNDGSFPVDEKESNINNNQKEVRRLEDGCLLIPNRQQPNKKFNSFNKPGGDQNAEPRREKLFRSGKKLLPSDEHDDEGFSNGEKDTNIKNNQQEARPLEDGREVMPNRQQPNKKFTSFTTPGSDQTAEPWREKLFRSGRKLFPSDKNDDEGSINDEKDTNIKSKIAPLVQQAVHDSERKVKSIQSLKEKHREEGPYRVGFILSMIKKARDVLNELFNVAVKHRDQWKALEQLKIFELVVHTNVDTTNLVRQMVEIHIQNLNATQNKPGKPGPGRNRLVLLK